MKGGWWGRGEGGGLILFEINFSLIVLSISEKDFTRCAHFAFFCLF